MAHELAEHGRETILRRHMCVHRVDEFLAIFAELEGVRPLHDVQMAVDGEAAAALGKLAREGSRRATGRHRHHSPAWERSVAMFPVTRP